MAEDIIKKKRKAFLTSQQELFLKLYLDPKSETFGSARASALEAKFSQSYANNITDLMPDWLSEFIGGADLVKKSEKTLDKTLNEEDKKYDIRLAQDTAKFIAKTLGKNKGYTEKTEVEHSGKLEISQILEEVQNE